MKKYKWIVLLNLFLLLLYFNYSVGQKEDILSNGTTVLLELAPVDPRSLMQGDYMNLAYKIAQNNDGDSLPKRGYCVLRLDKQGVGSSVRFQKDQKPLNQGEVLINYTLPDKWRIHIGAESFFFEEGQGPKFEAAKYGALRIDANGNSVLIGLYDRNMKMIKN